MLPKSVTIMFICHLIPSVSTVATPSSCMVPKRSKKFVHYCKRAQKHDILDFHDIFGWHDHPSCHIGMLELMYKAEMMLIEPGWPENQFKHVLGIPKC